MNTKACLIFLTVFLVFVLQSIAFAGQEITSCMVINQPGIYHLASNLYKPDSGPCITITASNVALDCNNYKIYGNRQPLQETGPESIGILVQGANNVALMECVLHNLGYGIRVEGSSNVNIMWSLIYSNRNGIYVTASSSYVTISSSEFHTNFYGVVFDNSNEVTITSTYIKGEGFPIKSYFHDNIMYSVFLNNVQKFYIFKTVFLDDVPLRIVNSNGYVIDNGFTGDFRYFNYISGDVKFFDTPVRDRECGINYLGGCGVGGNYYSSFSTNCRNDNKDSFCDSGYYIPIVPSGPRILDSYPLAFPQPFLKEPVIPADVNLRPGEYVDITIGVSWSHFINPVSIQCSPDSPITCQFISHNCNYNINDGSCQYVYRISAPLNTPLGGYNVKFTFRSGDCFYEKNVNVDVSSQACGGSVSLSLNPSRIKPGGSFTATLSGLSSCGGTAYVRLGSCSGLILGQCSVSGSGCSITISANLLPKGTHNIYGCFDINGNGIYESGEYDVKTLEIYEEVGPVLGNLVDRCGEIKSPGDYNLTTDIEANLDTCIRIVSDNVRLNCGGKSIYSNGKEVGIYVSGQNVQIRECVISGFKYGVVAENSNLVISFSKIIGSDYGLYARDYGERNSLILIFSSEFFNNMYGVYASNILNFITLCSSLKYENPELVNTFSGSINHSIYLSNVTAFSISCSEFNDRIPIKAVSSSGTISDSKFYGDFEKFEIVDSIVSFRTHFKAPPIAGTNVLGGCKIGGNYYSTNDNCRNRDLDSFCDSRYRVPGTNIYDDLPLANPQPYLKVGKEFYEIGKQNITIEEGSSTSFSIPIFWNYKIRDVKIDCNIDSPLDCKVEKKGCDFKQEDGSCYALVTVNVPQPPPNVNYTGMYRMNLTLSSGDCSYSINPTVLVYKIIYPPLYPDIPFLSIPIIAISLIFGFGTALEVGVAKRGGRSNGAILLSFIIVGIIALVLMKLITSFVLLILVIVGALMFAVILSKILGGW